jgi:hypothetical protein
MEEGCGRRETEFSLFSNLHPQPPRASRALPVVDWMGGRPVLRWSCHVASAGDLIHYIPSLLRTYGYFRPRALTAGSERRLLASWSISGRVVDRPRTDLGILQSTPSSVLPSVLGEPSAS